MKVLKLIRLSIWCALIAACISIIVLHLSISQVVSEPSQLRKIARQANTYEIVRSDILTPRILKEAQDAGYAELIDKPVVQKAVDKSFSDENLDTLLVPATESMANWLGSKQPDATFSIDASKQLTVLTDTLAAEITAKMLELPPCSFRNTLSDVATGKCLVPGLEEKEIRSGIITALRAQPTIQEGTLSSEQLNVPDPVISKTRNLPEYLNMLYSAAIFSGGILILSSLWLLFKHRFRGVATIGAGGLLATLIVFLAQANFVGTVNTLVLDPGYQELTRALARATAVEIRALLLPLLGVSAALTVVGAAGWFIVRRRRQAATRTSRVHFNESSSDDSAPTSREE